jgi:membrane peptidoglycan carboxypeptidase
LGNSLNIPAIEVLQYAKVHDAITMAHTLGIQPPSLTDESRYGLSLVLGGGEVRMIDMAAVYGAFANQGREVTPQAITNVTDKFGKNITKPTAKTDRQLIDGRIAYMITNILSDNNARIEEFGPNSPLKLSRPAAAKTGTTNDFRDNWAVGYTPDVVTAVWVGNNDHSPMNNVDGITGAAPIWHDYMEAALANAPAKEFAVPTGVIFAKVCASDGGLADPNDPKAITEVFLAEAPQTKKCGWASGEEPTRIKLPVVQVDRENPPALQAQAPAPAAPVEGGRGGGLPPAPQPVPNPAPPIPPTPPTPPLSGSGPGRPG